MNHEGDKSCWKSTVDEAMLPLEQIIRRKDTRIAELERALDEIRNAGYALSRSPSGQAATMCVPIAAWKNAMRILIKT